MNSIQRFFPGQAATLCLLLTVAVAIALPARAQSVPTIVSSIPAMLATGVSTTAPVVIKFSTAMDTNLTVATFYDLAAMTSPLPMTAAWSTDKTTLTCTPKPSFPASEPIVWSVVGEDLAGNPLGGTKGGEFITGTGTGGPSVVSVVPARMAVDVPPTTTVVFTFSGPMNTSVTWASFYDSSAPTVSLPAASSWSADKTTLTCTPNSSFPVGRTIIWAVVGEDPSGKALQGGSGSFTISAPGPVLLATVPADGDSGVSPSAPVVFVFSTTMDPDATVAQFANALDPSVSLPTVASWNDDQTELTCVPDPAFPAGSQITWTVTGHDPDGKTLTAASGSFGTSASGGVALISRGETVEQTDTNLFQGTTPEIIALASASFTSGVTVTAPSPGRTNWLGNAGWTDTLEFEDAITDTLSFATNYPTGTYVVTVLAAADPASALLSLTDGTLPSPPRLLNSQSLPHAALGESYPLQWDFAAGGATVDYVRLRVEQGGTVLFATPLPGAAGALTGASNLTVIPPEVLTNTARCEISLTAFSVTAADTNAIAGMTLFTARHRTTTFDLRVADGAVPPPALLTTNVPWIAISAPFLIPLRTTNGALPLRFELASGTLPPGLTLLAGGAISGEATNLGKFNAAIRVTDLLGRSSTQWLATATLPAEEVLSPIRLSNVQLQPGPALAFDLASTPGAQYVIERSLNLSNWTASLTTNATSDQLRVVLPLEGVGFFRARGPGLAPLPTPHPLTVSPVLNTNVSVSSWFSPFGGTLQLTNSQGYLLTLFIPPQALAASETITMTELSQVNGLPFDGGLRAAVSLEPDGLQFDVPARLDITVPPGVATTNLLGFNAQGDGTEFALTPTFVTNRTATLWLWHFSPQGMGGGTPANAQGQVQNGPTDPMSGYNQQVASTLAGCKADPSCDVNSDDKFKELVKVFTQMFDNVVRPKLIAAEADDAVLDDALRTWLEWHRGVGLLGLYDDYHADNERNAYLARRIAEGWQRCTNALHNALTKSCQRCLDHDLTQIGRMLQLARSAALLGNGFDREFWDCVDRCLRFRLDLESEITDTSGYNMTTHTKAKVELHWREGEGIGSTSSIYMNGHAFLAGSAEWEVTDQQFPSVAPCNVISQPKNGQLNLPYVSLALLKKKVVFVPGDGLVTNWVYSPDLVVAMMAGPSSMPKEKRSMVCPLKGPQSIPDLFAPTFNALHIQAGELQQPGGANENLADLAGGPVFVLTGFAGNGSSEIVMQKPYILYLGNQAFENTIVELHHTPGK